MSGLAMISFASSTTGLLGDAWSKDTRAFSQVHCW
jgi:hypothetical protein